MITFTILLFASRIMIVFSFRVHKFHQSSLSNVFFISQCLTKPKLQRLYATKSGGASTKTKVQVNKKNVLDTDGKVLVIVESPSKAKTIQKFLDPKRYIVDSSVGHVRDLIKSSKAPPAEAYKSKIISTPLGLKVSGVGIDVANNFEPLYDILPNKREVISRLQSYTDLCSFIIFATDEDREGEAISWHLLETIKPNIPYKRAVFHEISKSAIEKSFQSLKDIDMNLVHSQETRRILDRLAGYTLSPILWRYISRGLSAGRVQSCGLKLIVEKEKKRWDFISANYYSIQAIVSTKSTNVDNNDDAIYLSCFLHTINNNRIANEKDFDPKTGFLKGKDISETSIGKGTFLLTPKNIRSIMSWLNSTDTTMKIQKIDIKSVQKAPNLPFITSTLQQEASRRLHISPSVTMSLAQELYENGYITYMRTDSPKLSDTATQIALTMLKSQFESQYIGGKDRQSFVQKGNAKKNAQEAHEAIRPVENNQNLGRFYYPYEIKNLSDKHIALYTIILQRTLGTFMTNSVSEIYSYTILATINNFNKNEDIKNKSKINTSKSKINDEVITDIKYKEMQLRTTLTTLKFDGYLAIYDLYPLYSSSSSSSSKRGNDIDIDDFDTATADYVDEETSYEYNNLKKMNKIQKVQYIKNMTSKLTINTPLYLRPDLKSQISSNSSKKRNNSNRKIKDDIVDDDDNNDVIDTETNNISNDNNTINNEDNMISISSLLGIPHHTSPPNRFTESSFIKELEDVGVGRPSTYSSILQTLKAREYIIIDQRTILPTLKGIVVNDLLNKYFNTLVDTSFTANMEENLDLIAQGKIDRLEFLKTFYLGSGDNGKDNNNSNNNSNNKTSNGLLTIAENIINNNMIDQKTSRSLIIPNLTSQLHVKFSIGSGGGVIMEEFSEQNTNINNDAVSVSKSINEKNNSNSNSVNSGIRKSFIPGINTSVTNNRLSTSKRWQLPPSMQLDIRTLTPETLRHVMNTQLTTTGFEIPLTSQSNTVSSIDMGIAIANNNDGIPLPMYIKSGPYGKYLQIGSSSHESIIELSSSTNNIEEIKKKKKKNFNLKYYSLPEYIDHNIHTRENILEFTTLPKFICFHPYLEGQVKLILQMKNKQLCISIEGLPLIRNLPETIQLPSQVTNEIAINLFSDITKEKLSKMSLGLYDGQNVYLLPTKSNNNSYYLKWGDFMARLGKNSKNETFLSELTLDSAIAIINDKGIRLMNKNSSWTTKNKNRKQINKNQSVNATITSNNVSSNLNKVKNKQTVPKLLKIKTKTTTVKKQITNKALTEKVITNEKSIKSRQITGYQLYIKESSSITSSNMVKQKIVDLAKSWKNLSETEKNKYNTRAKDMPVS